MTTSWPIWRLGLTFCNNRLNSRAPCLWAGVQWKSLKFWATQVQVHHHQPWVSNPTGSNHSQNSFRKSILVTPLSAERRGAWQRRCRWRPRRPSLSCLFAGRPAHLKHSNWIDLDQPNYYLQMQVFRLFLKPRSTAKLFFIFPLCSPPELTKYYRWAHLSSLRYHFEGQKWDWPTKIVALFKG